MYHVMCSFYLSPPTNTHTTSSVTHLYSLCNTLSLNTTPVLMHVTTHTPSHYHTPGHALHISIHTPALTSAHTWTCSAYTHMLSLQPYLDCFTCIYRPSLHTCTLSTPLDLLCMYLHAPTLISPPPIPRSTI